MCTVRVHSRVKKRYWYTRSRHTEIFVASIATNCSFDKNTFHATLTRNTSKSSQTSFAKNASKYTCMKLNCYLQVHWVLRTTSSVTSSTGIYDQISFCEGNSVTDINATSPLLNQIALVIFDVNRSIVPHNTFWTLL